MNTKEKVIKEKRPILKNRFYLYLTEFLSGMSVMAVELGASRLMAPYISIPTVGTSITFLIFAGILLLLAIIYFVSGKNNIFKVRSAVCL